MFNLYTDIYLFRLFDGNLKVNKVKLPNYWGEETLRQLINNSENNITVKMVRDVGLDDIVDDIDFQRGGMRILRQSNDAVFYDKKCAFCFFSNNIAYIQANDLFEDNRYSDVFDCCFDDNTMQRKKADIQKQIDIYKTLCGQIDNRLDSDRLDSDHLDLELIEDVRYHKIGNLRHFVFIQGRPFIKILMILSGTLQIDTVNLDYYAIKYQINMCHDNRAILNVLSDVGRYNQKEYSQNQWPDMLDSIFDLPGDDNISRKNR